MSGAATVSEDERTDLAQRVTRVETKLEHALGAIGELKDSQKWLTRTVGAAAIILVLNLVAQIVRSLPPSGA